MASRSDFCCSLEGCEPKVLEEDKKLVWLHKNNRGEDKNRKKKLSRDRGKLTLFS